MPTMASQRRDAIVGISVYQQRCRTWFKSLPAYSPRYQLSPIIVYSTVPRPWGLGSAPIAGAIGPYVIAYVGKCLRRGGLCVVHKPYVLTIGPCHTLLLIHRNANYGITTS